MFFSAEARGSLINISPDKTHRCTSFLVEEGVDDDDDDDDDEKEEEEEEEEEEFCFSFIFLICTIDSRLACLFRSYSMSYTTSQHMYLL
tara:strand:+ start:221 stop:487 length:267 start_codon:yes stop_codon:yes gene_type:complete